MRRLLSSSLLLAAFMIAGCSLNRADFVAGPDGKPDRSAMSDDGKTISNLVQNGPRLGLKF